MSQLNNEIWSSPQVISENATQASNPDVAMDNNGNAIIVWEYWANDGGIAMMEKRNGAWSAPKAITAAGPPYTSTALPSVVMNDAGKAIIVWSQRDIYKKEYANGAWSDPVAVSSGGDTDYHQVVINNKGTAIITWRYNDHLYTHMKLYSREYQEGIWNDPKLISIEGKDPESFYQLAIGDNDNAIIVWHQSEDSNYRLYRNEYRNGNWIGPVAVTPEGTHGLYPKVAMDNRGNTILAWQQDVNFVWQVFISESHSGIWSAPTNVSLNGTDAEWPLVRMDNSGNKILLWNQRNGAEWQVYRMQFINGAWSDRYLLATSHNQLNFVNYDLAMDGTGDALMIWSQYDGINCQLYWSLFN
jgi:hypothetical protein